MTAELVSAAHGAPVRGWKPYPAYKDSGVEWLGEIPVHWNLVRLKFSMKINMGQSPASEECNLDGMGQPFLQGNAEFGKSNPIPKIYCSTARKLAQPKDLLLSVRAPVGALNVADQEYGIGRGLCAITPHTKLNHHYAWYLLEVIRIELNMVATGSTYEAVSIDQIGNIHCILPHHAEQHAIASFLDRKTTKLDTLISKKKRLIFLLKEKRAALISHTVTKGLDPDVPMKDSGVEWLGEIPAHWEVRNLKWNLEFLNSQRIPLSSEERGNMEKIYPYYGASGIIDYVEDYLFDEDLILIAEDGANLLNRSTSLAFLATGKYWVNNHAHILKPKNGCLNFWMYSLESFIFDPYISGSAQPKLNKENLSIIEFATPSKFEQKVIAVFLDRENVKLNTLISKLREAIEKLQEYRTALISAAVTGKIDVRNENHN